MSEEKQTTTKEQLEQYKEYIVLTRKVDIMSNTLNKLEMSEEYDGESIDQSYKEQLKKEINFNNEKKDKIDMNLVHKWDDVLCFTNTYKRLEKGDKVEDYISPWIRVINGEPEFPSFEKKIEPKQEVSLSDEKPIEN
ncbi:unnamed protein product, partial [marine sediment metagenome]